MVSRASCMRNTKVGPPHEYNQSLTWLRIFASRDCALEGRAAVFVKEDIAKSSVDFRHKRYSSVVRPPGQNLMGLLFLGNKSTETARVG